MRRLFAAVTLSVVMLFTGCSGVSQEEYKAQESAYSALQSENDALKSDISEMQSQINDINENVEDDKLDYMKYWLLKTARMLTIDYEREDNGKTSNGLSYNRKNANIDGYCYACVTLSADNSVSDIDIAKSIYSSFYVISDNDASLIMNNNLKEVLFIFESDGEICFVVYTDVDIDRQAKDVDLSVRSFAFDDEIELQVKNISDSEDDTNSKNDLPQLPYPIIGEIQQAETTEPDVTESKPDPEIVTDRYITKSKFDKLTAGMTYDEVVEIIGSDGELMSETDIGMGSEYITKMYCWYGKDEISNAVIMFQGGKLTSKSQFGL